MFVRSKVAPWPNGQSAARYEAWEKKLLTPRSAISPAIYGTLRVSALSVMIPKKGENANEEAA